ncbi:PAS domain-containing protein [soil metagenome]
MGALMRARDWSRTSLGEPSGWSPTLRTMIAMLLSSRQPMSLAWGPQLVAFYNDGYIELYRRTHPHGLGEPLEVLWGESFQSMRNEIAAVMAGQAQWFDDVPLQLHGTGEPNWFSFSWTPIRDESGQVAGMLNVANETTAKVLNAKRIAAEGESLAKLFDQSPSFMATVSGPDHRIEMANPSYLALVGRQSIEFGTPLARVLPDVAAQGYILALDRVYQSGEAMTGVDARYDVSTAGGAAFETRFVDFVFQPIKRADGTVCGIFIEGVDVTARSLAARALRESEARLLDLNAHLEREVLERSAVRGRFWQISPDLLLVVNGSGTIESANPAWTSVLGWSAAEIESRSAFAKLHPDDVAPTIRAFEDLKDGKPILRFENRYLAQDGSYRWFAWAAAPVGESYYGSGRDITFEKAQTETLAARTAERDRVWRNSRDLLALLSFDGTFRAVNPAWGVTLGYDTEAMVGRSYLDYIWPDDVAVLKAKTALDSTHAPLSNWENRYRHADGSLRLLSWHTLVEGDVVYAYGRDITRERDAQQQLQAAEEALRQAQKMDAIGQLTGGIAHDFNNMLAGITGSLEMIQRRLAKNRLDGIDRFIDMAQQSSRRAAALTQRLLAFARRQTLDPKPIDVLRLVRGMEELIRRTMGPSVEVSVTADDDVWRCKVDVSQLENALLNLCINARDAMTPNGGRLSIDIRNHFLREHAIDDLELAAGEYLAIRVTDTGTGMPAEVIARAFDPFFTTKPMGEGTGLGLSMVYGFVRQSGGQVKVDSEVGCGTTMRVFLPRYNGATETMPIKFNTPEASTGEGQKILLIDDEAAVRMLVAEVLREAGYKVTGAADGETGLGVLRSSEHIDLLITDVGLPGGKNGRQIADEARALRPGLKVLFITGYAENAALGNGDLEDGMEVMTKPFELSALVTRVQDMVVRAGHATPMSQAA